MHGNFLNPHAGQTRTSFAQEFTSEGSQVKREQVRVCTKVFSTLISWSKENESCMRVDES